MTTSPPWTAERSVTVGEATRLIDTYAPELRGLPIVALAEGWDNTVFVVGGRWALRLPRRRVALPGIEREITVLPAIAPLLSLPVPVPELVGHDLDPSEPWPWTLARLLPGREFAEADLPGRARRGVASAVGGFLRILHSEALRDAATGAGVELPLDPLQRGWPRPRVPQVRADLERLGRSGVWRGDQAVVGLLDRAGELDPPTARPVLVHGDLHVRHLLVDDERVTGVIDWGDLCLADPAVDLAIAYAAFEGASRAALFDAYGSISAETELRARALAVRLSVLLADYATRDGRAGLQREALRGLDRACR